MTTKFMDKMRDEARLRRLRVVHLRQAGLKFEEIAKLLGVTRARAYQIWALAEKNGETDGVRGTEP